MAVSGIEFFNCPRETTEYPGRHKPNGYVDNSIAGPGSFVSERRPAGHRGTAGTRFVASRPLSSILSATEFEKAASISGSLRSPVGLVPGVSFILVS